MGQLSCVNVFLFLWAFVKGHSEVMDTVGPRFSVEPPGYVDFSNQTGVGLDCVASGNPSPSIEWLLGNGSRASAVARLRYVLPNGTLVLPPFRAEEYTHDVHAALYKCRASNTVGVIVSRNVRVRAVVVQTYDAQVHDEFIIAGNTAVMKCQIPSFVADYVTVTSWLRDSSFNIYPNYDEVGGKYLLLPSGELQIRDVRTTDAFSTYRCRTTHRLSKETRFSTTAGKIIVTEPHGTIPPRITENKVTLTVSQGEAVILPCTAQAHPVPTYSWYKKVENGNNNLSPVTYVEGRLMRAESNLLLRDVNQRDSGIYICSVENAVGTERVEVLLEVTVPLEATIEPTMIEADIDEEAELRCVVRGNPIMSMIWLKDGRLLSPEDVTSINNDVLYIQSMSKKHGGMYQCVVSNEEDSVQATAEIKLGDIPPDILYLTEAEAIHPGQQAALKCIASGNPLPQVKWTLDDQTLPINDRFHVTAFTNEDGNRVSSLNISQIKTEDGGKYTCLAASKTKLKKKSTRINVYGRPYVRPMASKSVVAGSNVYIPCPYYGYPIDSISWEKAGVRLPINHLQVVYANGTLKLVSVQRSDDAGIYTCIVQNVEGQHARRDLDVKILVPPRINPTSFQEMQLHEGSHARIICAVVEGDLPISFTWSKDGRAILPELSVAIRGFDEFSSVLTLSKAAHKHGGNYTCVAENAAATDSYTAHITVNVPPQIIPFSFQGDFLFEGTLARVACVVSQGDLPLSIIWIKDSNLIAPDLGVTVRDFDEHSSVLTINQVTSRHNGNYTCISENSAGTTNFTAQLITKVPPRWVVQPVDVSSVKGSRALIDCQATGFPEPTVEWFRAVESSPGEYQPLRMSDSSIQILDNGSLVFPSIRAEHEGRYLCRATNGVGNGLSKMSRVIVKVPPTIDDNNRNQSVVNGQDAKMSCVAKGDLPIRIMWLRNQEVITIVNNNFRYKIQENKLKRAVSSELTVSNCQRNDSLIYVCVAENEFGKDELQIRLIVIERPDPPKDLLVVDEAARTIKFAWVRPYDGNSPIKEFILSIKYAKDQWNANSLNITVHGENNSVTATNLRPGTAYHAKLFAINEAGISKPSSVINFNTLTEAPTDPPENVRAVATDKGGIKVTWRLSKDDLMNHNIGGFYIGYKVYGSVEPFSSLTYDGPLAEEMSTMLENLRHFTKYSVTVQSYNHIGTGPLSDEVIVLTSEHVPEVPPENIQCSALSSESLHVKWAALPLGGLNGVIQGYKVIYRPDHEWYEEESETKITSEMETVLSGLQKYTNYTIEALAFTKMGDGKRSDPIVCSTSEDVPQAPADIKVVASSLDSIMITWQPPLRPNGIIKKYTVYMRRLDLSNEDVTKNIVTGKIYAFEATNLKNNKRYEFWVTASTSIGEGQSTPVIALSTGAPIVPSKVVSFGGPIRAAWKTNIQLQCKAVGIPPPQREWNLKGKVYNSSDLRTIMPDGTLEILEAQPEDSGNYSCRVFNSFGADEITYYVFVDVPPIAPDLFLTSTTYNSIAARWEKKRENRLPTLGYYLYYKRDFGEWEEIFVSQEYNQYQINGLECGTRYQMCIAAVSKLGKGKSSELVVAKTKGSAPVQPLRHHFITEDRHSVLLRLDSWLSGGCLILYFVVEYKLTNQRQWKLVSNNVLYDQREFLIPDLNSSTWYSLRVTAHNNAGSTTAIYEFATRNPFGGTIAPMVDLNSNSASGIPLVSDIRILIPALVSIVVLMLLITFICLCYKRKQMREEFYAVKATGNDQESRQEVKTACEKNSSVGSFTYLLRSNSKVAFKDSATLLMQKENVSPYATTHIATCQNKERIYGQILANHPSALKTKEDIGEGTFPRTKKHTQLLLQHFPQSDAIYNPADYIHPFPGAGTPRDKFHNLPRYSSQNWVQRSSATSGNDFQVPDLLDHSAESSTSNESCADYPSKEYEGDGCPSETVERQLYPNIDYNSVIPSTGYIYSKNDPKYKDEELSENEYDRENEEPHRITSFRRNQSQPIHRHSGHFLEDTTIAV